MSPFRRLSRAEILAATGLVWTLAAPALAQDAAADEAASGNEIVVTATKRDQTIQDVPF